MKDSEDHPDLEEVATHSGGRWSGRGFITGVAVGALLGAGLALFFASEQGERVTGRVREGWDDLKDETRRELRRRRKDLRSRLDGVVRSAQEKVEEVFD